MSGHREGGLRFFHKDTGEPLKIGDIPRLHAEKLAKEYKKTTLTPLTTMTTYP